MSFEASQPEAIKQVVDLLDGKDDNSFYHEEQEAVNSNIQAQIDVLRKFAFSEEESIDERNQKRELLNGSVKKVAQQFEIPPVLIYKWINGDKLLSLIDQLGDNFTYNNITDEQKAIVQTILRDTGGNMGKTGENQDGIDMKFGELTFTATRNLQIFLEKNGYYKGINDQQYNADMKFGEDTMGALKAFLLDETDREMIPAQQSRIAIERPEKNNKQPINKQNSKQEVEKHEVPSSQSEEFSGYMHSRIQELRGIQYRYSEKDMGLDCEEFVQEVIAPLYPDFTEKYKKALSRRPQDTTEVFTAFLTGELPEDQMNDMSAIDAFRKERIWKGNNNGMKHLQIDQIDPNKPIQSSVEGLIAKTKQQVRPGEFAVLSYSFEKGGHTGLVFWEGNRLVFANSGLIEEQGNVYGVEVEDLGTHLKFLFQRTRGEIEWVSEHGAYFQYEGRQKGHLITANDIDLGRCEPVYNDARNLIGYTYKGNRLNLTSSQKEYAVTFTTATIPVNDEAERNMERLKTNERILVAGVIENASRIHHDTEIKLQWTNDILHAMRMEGIPITNNNVRYFIGLGKEESDLLHNPKRYVERKRSGEKAGEGLLRLFGEGSWFVEGVKRLALNENEQRFLNDTRDSFAHCDTELDMYKWAQDAKQFLQQNPDLFSNNGLLGKIFERYSGDFVSILKGIGIDIEGKKQGETWRMFMIRTLDNKPSSFGFLQLNANLIVARMDADPEMDSDPRLSEFHILFDQNGSTNLDLLKRNLVQDPSLPRGKRISTQGITQLAARYYIRPNIFANSVDGKLSDPGQRVAVADHMLGINYANNAAIQNKLNHLYGGNLVLDGDLVFYDGLRPSPDRMSSTQKVVRKFIEDYIPEWSNPGWMAREIVFALSEMVDIKKSILARRMPPSSIFLQKLDDVCSEQNINLPNQIVSNIKSQGGQSAVSYVRKFEEGIAIV